MNESGLMLACGRVMRITTHILPNAEEGASLEVPANETGGGGG